MDTPDAIATEDHQELMKECLGSMDNDKDDTDKMCPICNEILVKIGSKDGFIWAHKLSSVCLGYHKIDELEYKEDDTDGRCQNCNVEYSVLSTIWALACGHLFCRLCVWVTLSSNHKVCPVCEKDVRDGDFWQVRDTSDKVPIEDPWELAQNTWAQKMEYKSALVDDKKEHKTNEENSVQITNKENCIVETTETSNAATRQTRNDEEKDEEDNKERKVSSDSLRPHTIDGKKDKEDDKGKKCQACNEEHSVLSTLWTLACGHLFCALCVWGIISTDHNVCPICEEHVRDGEFWQLMDTSDIVPTEYSKKLFQDKVYTVDTSNAASRQYTNDEEEDEEDNKQGKISSVCLEHHKIDEHKYTEDDQVKKCQACYDEHSVLSTIWALPCGHFFCRLCFWGISSSDHNICPVCEEHVRDWEFWPVLDTSYTIPTENSQELGENTLGEQSEYELSLVDNREEPTAIEEHSVKINKKENYKVETGKPSNAAGRQPKNDKEKDKEDEKE